MLMLIAQLFETPVLYTIYATQNKKNLFILKSVDTDFYFILINWIVLFSP